MAFQTSVLSRMGAGLPGELAFEDGGLRATPAMLASEDAVNNVFGRVFTLAQAPEDAHHEGIRVQAGGDGVVIGILANPKEHVAYGVDWTSTLTLPNGVIAGFVSCGYVFVELQNNAEIGDAVAFDTATGELYAGAPADGQAALPSAMVYRYPVTGAAPATGGLAVVRITDPNLQLAGA